MAEMIASRWLRRSAVAGVIGLAATALAAVFAPERALLAYLAAYAAVIATAVGALVLLLVGYATNARWMAALRRLQEAITSVFPILAVLFIPIAIGLGRLYPWAELPPHLTGREREAIHATQSWLNPAGFALRSALYLVIFTVAAEVLRRWSLRRDELEPTDDPEDALSRDRTFAAAMLPFVALALTFASIDWLMSLQPGWVSSMFGVYIFAGGFAAGIAVLAIVAALLREPLGLTGNHFHALGRLLFAFVIFWAYTSYFQGFLIQIANRPAEVTFYVDRLGDAWRPVLWAMVATRFVLPFFLLLPRRLKHRPRYLAAVAVVVLVGHALDLYWIVIPSGRFTPSWVDLAALVGVAGAATAFALWRAQHAPLTAHGDPFLAASFRYESPT